jgi:hypothetical protein
MATTDTGAAIGAIRDLYCDAEATLEVLTALTNVHAEWLKSQDIEVTGSDAVRLMDEAIDALGESHDAHRTARSVADDAAHATRVLVVNTGAADELLRAA